MDINCENEVQFVLHGMPHWGTMNHHRLFLNELVLFIKSVMWYPPPKKKNNLRGGLRRLVLLYVLSKFGDIYEVQVMPHPKKVLLSSIISNRGRNKTHPARKTRPVEAQQNRIKVPEKLCNRN